MFANIIFNVKDLTRIFDSRTGAIISIQAMFVGPYRMGVRQTCLSFKKLNRMTRVNPASSLSVLQ